MTTTYPRQIKKDGVPQSVHLMLWALVKIEILDDGVRRLESMLLVFHQQSRGGMGSLIMGPWAVIKPLPTPCLGGLGVPWEPDRPKFTGWLALVFSGRSSSLWFFLFWLVLVEEANEPPTLIERAATFLIFRALLVPRSISEKQRVKINESTVKNDRYI